MTPGAVFGAWLRGGPMRLDLLTHDLPALGIAMKDRVQDRPDMKRLDVLREVCRTYGAEDWGVGAIEDDGKTVFPPVKVLPPLPDECPRCKGPIKEWWQRKDGYNPGVSCKRGHFTSGDFGRPVEVAVPTVPERRGATWLEEPDV